MERGKVVWHKGVAYLRGGEGTQVRKQKKRIRKEWLFREIKIFIAPLIILPFLLLSDHS